MTEYVVVFKDGVTVCAAVVKDSDVFAVSEDDIIRKAVEICGITRDAQCWISSLDTMRKRQVTVTRQVEVQE